jgi:hypothetical protein
MYPSRLDQTSLFRPYFKWLQRILRNARASSRKRASSSQETKKLDEPGIWMHYIDGGMSLPWGLVSCPYSNSFLFIVRYYLGTRHPRFSRWFLCQGWLDKKSSSAWKLWQSSCYR